jgi:hypothetical protein
MKNYKEFSMHDYTNNDPKSKKIAVEFLESLGYFRLVVPLNRQKEQYKKYDFEIMSTTDSMKVGIEVERKSVWYKNFEWLTVDIPGRKKVNQAQIYILLNNDYTQIAMTPMKNILKSNTIFKNTKYSENEEFFSVDYRLFNFYKKENNNWVEIKK